MSDIKTRKNSHLKICLGDEVDMTALDLSGFSNFQFEHDALPEIDFNKIDTSIELFGKKLSAPIIIGAMTGGSEKAAVINERLARAAQETGIGLALGSQRAMLESPDMANSYDVRAHAPRIPLLFGNIGAVQLNYGVTITQLKSLVRAVSCDAFTFHLNPLQEAVSPEGDVNFSGLIGKIDEVASLLGVPVLLKEVGSGISETTARKIASMKIAGVETGGVGGTSWSLIESLRCESDPVKKAVGLSFSQWGISTAMSIINSKKLIKGKTIIASGGIRNGIEIAKALSLGADAAALALPFLKAADQSTGEVIKVIMILKEELKTAMFLTGSATIADLKQKL